MSNMHLYSLTLQKSSAISIAVAGNFSDVKTQEIAVARGKVLQLYREVKGRLKSVFVTEVFGLIRTMNSFRLIGKKATKTKKRYSRFILIISFNSFFFLSE